MLKARQAAIGFYFFYILCLGAFFYGITRTSISVFLLSRVPQYTFDFVQLLMIWLVAFNIGHLIIQRLHLKFRSSVDLAVNFTALGLGILSLMMLGIGVFSLYYRWVGWTILVLGCCWSVAHSTENGTLKQLFNRCSTSLNLSGLGYVCGLSLVVAVSAMVYSLVVNALVPPLEWDSMAYHLAVPRLYIEAHKIIYIPYIVHSNWPFNMEMLYTLALLVGSERLPQLIAFSFSVLTGLAMFGFASHHFDRRVGFLSLSFFFSLPIIRKVSGTAMVDIPLGLFGFLAVLAFWRWLEERGEGWLVLSALFGGIAAGIKLTGASTPLLLGVGLFIIVIVKWLRTKRFLLREMLLFGAISFSIVSPWYLKSYVTTGNPVWPFLNNVFLGKDWDTFGTLVHNFWLHLPGTGISITSLMLLPWNLFLSGSFGPPLGIAVIAFLPAAIVYYRKAKLTWFLILFAVATTLIWFYLTQQNRFLTPMFPVICLLAGAGYWRIHDSAPYFGKGALAAVLTLLMFLSSPYISAPEKELWNQRVSYVTGYVSRETLLTEVVNAYAVFSFANANLSTDARILLLPYENRGFYLDRAYFWGNPVSQRVLKFEQMQTAAELWRTVKGLGFSHVIINPTVDLPQMFFSQRYNALIDDFKNDYLLPIYTANGVTLYEVYGQD